MCRSRRNPVPDPPGRAPSRAARAGGQHRPLHVWVREHDQHGRPPLPVAGNGLLPTGVRHDGEDATGRHGNPTRARRARAAPPRRTTRAAVGSRRLTPPRTTGSASGAHPSPRGVGPLTHRCAEAGRKMRARRQPAPRSRSSRTLRRRLTHGVAAGHRRENRVRCAACGQCVRPPPTQAEPCVRHRRRPTPPRTAVGRSPRSPSDLPPRPGRPCRQNDGRKSQNRQVLEQFDALVHDFATGAAAGRDQRPDALRRGQHGDWPRHVTHEGPPLVDTAHREDRSRPVADGPQTTPSGRLPKP